MITIFEATPIPRRTIIIGIQDIGGIGLIISNKGRRKRSKFLYHPISSPRGMPIKFASTKPASAILRLSAICAGKSAPSGSVV